MKLITSTQPQKRPFAARRRGSVLTLTVLSTVVLLSCAALVVDYSTLSVDANRLQRGCDAAALAGVGYLKVTSDDNANTTSARALAVYVAAQNNVTVNPNNVTFSNNNTQIQVAATATRAYFFAPIMGVRSGVVSRKAKAAIYGAQELSTAPNTIRVVPLGITWETYNAYKDDRTGSHEIEMIRQNKETFGKDDFVLFDLREQNSKSPAKMQDQLTGQIVEYTTLGDAETTLNAADSATSKKVADGLQTLFNRSQGAPWYDSDNSGSRYNDLLSGTGLNTNPRVVNLIVTPSTSNPKNGTYNTEVQGFAPVYLESYQNGNGETSIRIRFLPPLESSTVTPNTDPNAAFSGVRVTNMLLPD